MNKTKPKLEFNSVGNMIMKCGNCGSSIKNKPIHISPKENRVYKICTSCRFFNEVGRWRDE